MREGCSRIAALRASIQATGVLLIIENTSGSYGPGSVVSSLTGRQAGERDDSIVAAYLSARAHGAYSGLELLESFVQLLEEIVGSDGARRRAFPIWQAGATATGSWRVTEIVHVGRIFLVA